MTPEKPHSKELPLDRLATTDAEGNRIYLYPADVRGRFRQLRTWLSLILTCIFLSLPWIQIGGQPAVLLDFFHKKFALFGFTFWAHDAPLLAFLLGGGFLALSFVTSIWGRVWCGWACPQTVFVDSLFRRIERWIEGDSISRKKLDSSPISMEKLFKKTSKWTIFTLIGILISHCFVAYFVGTQTLLSMMNRSPFESPESFSSFLIMTIVTAGVLFDFGWFREQFCTLVCPYGRFQSVLMDDYSQVIYYDQQRGEPRRGSSTSDAKGDCVNCYRCVQVCPTGIDIRRGLQLECVACTACIDACNEVMTRLNQPKDLIRYKSGQFHTRGVILGGLLTLVILGLIFTLRNRERIEMTWIRAIDTPYQTLQSNSPSDTTIVNHFKVDLRNQAFEDQQIVLEISPENTHFENFHLVSPSLPLTLHGGESARIDTFVRFKQSDLNFGKARVKVLLQLNPSSNSNKSSSDYSKTIEVTLVGPLN